MSIVNFQKFGLLFLTLTSFLTAAAQRQNPCSEEQPYKYQTRLRGGYRIVFKTDSKEFKSLYLYKGRRRTVELSGVSCGMPHKNLGYVGADFRNYFVLVQSYGSGNPSPIQLIRKTDGKNTIRDSSAWIDASIAEDLLIYSENHVPEPGDKFTVLNIRSFRREYYPFPDGIFGEPEVLNRIEDVIVNPRTVVVKYRVGAQKKTKSYQRRR